MVPLPPHFPPHPAKQLVCVTQHSPAMACCICFVAATSVHAELDDRSSSVLALSSCICTLDSDSWQWHIFMSSHYTHRVTHLYMPSHYTHRLAHLYMLSPYTHRLTHFYTSSNYTTDLHTSTCHCTTHTDLHISHYTHRLAHLQVIRLHTQTYVPLHVLTLHTDLCTSTYHHTTHTETYAPLHIITLHTHRLMHLYISSRYTHTETYTPLHVITLHTQT